MYPSILRRGFAIACTVCCAYAGLAIAQEDNGNAYMRQLSSQEHAEYRARMDTAGSETEKGQIENEYQAMARERAQLKEGKGSGQVEGGANRNKGQGMGNPSTAGKAGPYGSKNKPQKSGK